MKILKITKIENLLQNLRNHENPQHPFANCFIQIHEKYLLILNLMIITQY